MIKESALEGPLKSPSATKNAISVCLELKTYAELDPPAARSAVGRDKLAADDSEVPQIATRK